MSKGPKCMPKSRPCTKVCTMCTPPLVGQTRDERTLHGSQQAAICGRSWKRIRLSHVVTTTSGHERVTANNWPPESAKRTTHKPRFQQAEGPPARTLTPPPTQLHRPPRRQARTAASVRGNRRGKCPHIKAKTPLTRGYACPRWDSNRTPAPASAGNSRKDPRSKPIRCRYGRVRRQMCAQCAHLLLAHFPAPCSRPAR